MVIIVNSINYIYPRNQILIEMLNISKIIIALTMTSACSHAATVTFDVLGTDGSFATGNIVTAGVTSNVTATSTGSPAPIFRADTGGSSLITRENQNPGTITLGFTVPVADLQLSFSSFDTRQPTQVGNFSLPAALVLGTGSNFAETAVGSGLFGPVSNSPINSPQGSGVIEFTSLAAGEGITEFSFDLAQVSGNFGDGITLQIQANVVPEPSSMSFLGLASVGLLLRRKR